jgi:hypothetical protein
MATTTPRRATITASVPLSGGGSCRPVVSRFAVAVRPVPPIHPDQNDPPSWTLGATPRDKRPRLHLREGRLVVPWNVYARAKAANSEAPASTATRAGRDLERTLRTLKAAVNPEPCAHRPRRVRAGAPSR